MGRPRARASARVFATHSRALHSTRAFASPETRYRWCFWTRFLSPASTPRPAASVAVSRVTMRFVAAITRSRQICTQLPSMRRPRPRRWPPPSSETVRRRTSRWTAPLTRSRTPSVPSRSAPPSRPTRPSPGKPDSATPSSPSVAPRTRARRIATPSSTPPATPPSSTDSGRRARRCARATRETSASSPRPRPRPGRLAPRRPQPRGRQPRVSRGAPRRRPPHVRRRRPRPGPRTRLPRKQIRRPPRPRSRRRRARGRASVRPSRTLVRQGSIPIGRGAQRRHPPRRTRRVVGVRAGKTRAVSAPPRDGEGGEGRRVRRRRVFGPGRRGDATRTRRSRRRRRESRAERTRTNAAQTRTPSPSPSEIPMFHLAAIRREPHDSERATAFRDAVRTSRVRTSSPSVAPRRLARPLARFRRRGGRRRRVFSLPARYKARHKPTGFTSSHGYRSAVDAARARVVRGANGPERFEARENPSDERGERFVVAEAYDVAYPWPSESFRTRTIDAHALLREVARIAGDALLRDARVAAEDEDAFDAAVDAVARRAVRSPPRTAFSPVECRPPETDAHAETAFESSAASNASSSSAASNASSSSAASNASSSSAATRALMEASASVAAAADRRRYEAPPSSPWFLARRRERRRRRACAFASRGDPRWCGRRRTGGGW